MNLRLFFGVAIVALALLVFSGLAHAVDSEVGRLILKQECSQCHAINLEGESPLKPAPPFRDVARRYPPANLMEALAEGIVTGHNNMPEFEFSPDEISAIVGYLETLRSQ